MTKILRLVAAVALFGLVLVMAPAPPAGAHANGVRLPHPYVDRGSASVSNAHYEFSACDWYADGWGVRGYFLLETETIRVAWDTNGSKPGCGHADGGGYRAVYFWVCFGPNGEDRVCSPGVDA